MELDTKSISILNKPRKTVTSPRLLTINHERQKPLFCPKTLARQALEPQVFRPESLQSNFSDSSIVMLCNADVVSKELQPTCLTQNGDIVCGQVLILATNESPDDLCLLNVRQAKIVKEELKLYPKPVKPEHNFSASLWDID